MSLTENIKIYEIHTPAPNVTEFTETYASCHFKDLPHSDFRESQQVTHLEHL